MDIGIKCIDKQGIIEVKSFVDLSELKRSQNQSAEYAEQLSLKAVTLAVFVPVEDENVLKKLCSEKKINGVNVSTEAIGWV